MPTDKIGRNSVWFKTFVVTTRACAVGPLIALDAWGIPTFVIVKNNLDYLAAPPLSEKILRVEGLTGPLATVLTTGNMFAAVYVVQTFRRQLVYIGIVDLAVCAALIWTAVVQSRYVALTKGQCTTALASDQTPVFITRMRDVVTENMLYGFDPCEVYLQIFYIRVVAIFFYVLTDHWGRPRHAQEPDAQERGPTISVLRWLLALPFLIAYYIAIDTVRFWGGWYLDERKVKQPEVQIRAQQWRAFRKRMSFKGAAILDMQNPIVAFWRGLGPRIRRPSPVNGALTRMLQEDRIARGIAGHLHHVELVNLSVTCTAIRAALYPDGKCALRERTCHLPIPWEAQRRWIESSAARDQPSAENGAPAECWGCGVRLCKGCFTTRRIRGTHVFYHMEGCGAQCSKCFASTWREVARCRCQDRRRRWWDTSTAPNRYYSDRNVWVQRDICRDCSGKTDEAVREWRERRDRHDHHKAVRDSLSCLTCGDAIEDAVLLWWVCKKCQYECRSLEHPCGRG